MAIVFNNLSGGGGGSKLYKHLIKINTDYLIIYNTSSDAYTTETLSTYLFNNGFNSETKYLPYSSTNVTASGTTITVYSGIFSTNGSSLKSSTQKINVSIVDNNISMTSGAIGKQNIYDSVIDTVTEL